MDLKSKSWLDLESNVNMDGIIEPFEEYYSRIKLKKEYAHIPEEVFRQWIHPHHRQPHTIRNYSWLDFKNVEFELCEWPYEMLEDINVIKDFQPLVFKRGGYTTINDFYCTDIDKEYWKSYGTWRTPPIILEVAPLHSIKPLWSEMEPPYQLVEGHQRFGYLKSMKFISNSGQLKLADKHKIFLMKTRQY
ncbi:hypothetical protein [uncultured Pontibacter sp.]|uniref:hypothetical protein n=1 Tax=uncultured Pontibacter sp. TaxID=453356 RepID=UPI002617C642|nr:hypothetical protein [uncultured Pontibacter sp.]